MSNAVSGAGIVSTAFFPVSFYGRNLFKMNSGSCLAVSTPYHNIPLLCYVEVKTSYRYACA